MPQLARRFETLPEYVLARIPQKKQDLLKRGVDVIDLGPGDADLMPPEVALRRLPSRVHPRHEPLRLWPRSRAVPRRVRLDAERFGLRFDPLQGIVPLIGSKEGLRIWRSRTGAGRVAIILNRDTTPISRLAVAAEGVQVPLVRARVSVELETFGRRAAPREGLVSHYPNIPTSAIAPSNTCSAS